MADEKDKKISEVPHLENVTGVEKIPVSAVGGLPRYVEVNQIVDKATDSIESISAEYIDSLFVTPPQVSYEVWLVSYKEGLAPKFIALNITTQLRSYDTSIDANANTFILELEDRMQTLPCLIISYPTMEQAEGAQEHLASGVILTTQCEIKTEIRTNNGNK